MKEERRMILRMVEEGKITSDEGVALLEALERSVSAEEKESKTQHKQTDQGSESYKKSYKDDFPIDEIKREFSAKAEKLKKEFSSQGKTVTTRVSALVEKFITKVKDFDFDFDFDFPMSGLKIEKVFAGTVGTKNLMDLLTVNGSIQIEGWDKSEYRIEASALIKADNDTEAKTIMQQILQFEEDDDRLSLRVEKRKGTKVSLRVSLPKQLSAELHLLTSNGSIDLKDIIMGEAKLETHNGAIHFDRCHGENIYCVTSNGKISAEESVIDELYAKSSNGALRLSGIYKKTKCRTSNGSIRFALKEVTEGYLDLKTNHGSIEVSLPPTGMHIQGEVSTTFGPIDCTLPQIEFTSTSKEPSNRNLSFRSIQEEGKPYDLICKTSNGAIRVHALQD